MIKPKEYIEKEYKKDLEKFGNVMCGMTMSIFYKDEKRELWPYLDHFLICQYELNLLNQIIYSNFNIDHKKWLEDTLPFSDCNSCPSNHGGVEHPLSILWVAERELSKRGKKFKISRSLILEYDKYFLNYIKNVCKNNNFSQLNPEILIKALKEDPDCNNDQVKRFFNIRMR